MENNKEEIKKEFDFQALIEANKKKKLEEAERRAKDNKKVLKEYK